MQTLRRRIKKLMILNWMKSKAAIPIVMMFLGLFVQKDANCQVIVDNTFAFGFKNVFDWNLVFVEKESNGNFVRMILFEDVASIKERLVVCQLREFEDQTLYKAASLKGFRVVDSLANPYDKQKTLIVAGETPSEIHALIFHFNFLLTISYIDRRQFDDVRFKEFVKSYVNMKVNF